MTFRQIGRAVWRATEGLVSRNGIEIGGYIAFTTMLSLFPFLIFLVSIAGFVGDTRTGQDFIATMSMFAPPDVMKTLRPALDEVIQSRSGGLLTFGLVLALYSAGSGIAALRLALNLSYGVTADQRPFWLRKAIDFAVVIVGSIVVTLASASIILGPWILRLVARFTDVNANATSLWPMTRYGSTMIVVAFAVMALHRVLPGCQLTVRQILPGALTTTIAWIIAASLLPIYFGEFANYSSTYGSLGGVIITLLFFYVSAIIFIFGGELNAALLGRHKGPRQDKPEARPSLASS